MWQKEGYHVDYTKCPYIPDDRDDITEYAELASTLNNPSESCVATNIKPHVTMTLASTCRLRESSLEEPCATNTLGVPR